MAKKTKPLSREELKSLVEKTKDKLDKVLDRVGSSAEKEGKLYTEEVQKTIDDAIDKAIRSYDLILEENPVYIPALIRTVNLLYQRRRIDDNLLQRLDDLIDLYSDFENQIARPFLGILYCLRGNVKIGLGKTEESVPDINKALELDPKSTTNNLNQAIAFYILGNYDHAKMHYGIARKYCWSDDPFRDIIFFIGILTLYSSGDDVNARRLLKEFNSDLSLDEKMVLNLERVIEVNMYLPTGTLSKRTAKPYQSQNPKVKSKDPEVDSPFEIIPLLKTKI